VVNLPREVQEPRDHATICMRRRQPIPEVQVPRIVLRAHWFTPLMALTISVGAYLYDHSSAGGQPRRPGFPTKLVPMHRRRPHDAAVEQHPVVPRTCPDRMVLAEGDYCINADQFCLRWLDPVTQLQCAEFDQPQCTGRRRHVAVCLDQYEYPNQAGVNPMVMVNWYEARRLCRTQNKRLCTESEWTFACEGPEMNPYPNGVLRSRRQCRLDWQPFGPDHRRLGDRDTVIDESARLYGAMPSGSMPRCVAWSGAHDMAGNVDEWVVNEEGVPFQSALKGGWWGPIRGRCRPATTAHHESFVYYQIGFRCCADPMPVYTPTSPDSGSATMVSGGASSSSTAVSVDAR
jgi:hypothetical protein